MVAGGGPNSVADPRISASPRFNNIYLVVAFNAYGRRFNEENAAAIADGEVAQGIIGYDPISNGQLTREEIQRCEADSEARLQQRDR